MDVLCHALESYTARPFDARPKPEAPASRPAYNGSNPISDIWATRALGLLGRWFRRAVDQPGDLEAREGMMLAATYAGIGFGNAGVHLPHACAYPIAGLVRDYRAPDYPGTEPLDPARARGRGDGRGGLPLHLPDEPRAARGGRPAADRRPARRRDRRLAERRSPTSVATSEPRAAWPRTAMARRTSTRSSRERSGSSDCWPSARGRRRPRTSPRSSANRWNPDDRPSPVESAG